MSNQVSPLKLLEIVRDCRELGSNREADLIIEELEATDFEFHKKPVNATLSSSSYDSMLKTIYTDELVFGLRTYRKVTKPVNDNE